METPWKVIVAADGNREYVALLSYLPLRRYSKIPAFFRYTLQIQAQMRKTAGAMGYSMRAKVFGREFWTLSMWEDDRALMKFVQSAPHGEVMKAIAPHMGATKFTRWKLRGSAFPPAWDDAMKRESKGS